MKNSDIFGNYQAGYRASKKHSAYPYTQKIEFNEVCNILFFDGLGSKTFLIVPSVFNSYEILTLGYPLDIITYLRKMGNVYLIEWLEVKDKDFGLDNYASLVAQILKSYGNVHLIGHCLGGNFAIAASVIYPEKVESLILLTTPWDFSHFVIPKKLYDTLGLARAVEGMDHIPFLYMQILFFLLSPESFEQKLDYFQENQKDIADSKFFEIERWQFSGHAISRKTYDDLMDYFIDGNILVKKLWIVDQIVIDPSKIKSPIMIVSGSKDKLVPTYSSSVLSGFGDLFEYNSGHIGYLVGSQRKQFAEDLAAWIENLG